MVSEEIRALLRSIPAVLVVEDGRPAYVITEFETFRQLSQGQSVRVRNIRPGHGASNPPAQSAQEAQVLEQLNKEILSLRNQIQMQEDAIRTGLDGAEEND
jgi:TolA-binding protein